jgi:CheY-like chemotaxis protein
VEHPFEILVVEDSPVDAYLTLEALRGTKTMYNVHVVGDGVAALKFLRRHPPHTAAPRPDIILLDINLPQMDGKEVLAELKIDELLLDIPIVVMSGSARQDDIDYAYRHHAACYITKSPKLDEYFTAVRTLMALLFHTASLPKRATAAQITI